MPVYLCRPGHASTEPWRHGVQVYAYPFRIDGTAAAGATIGDAGGGSGGGAAAVASVGNNKDCLLYTSPSPRDVEESRMPSSA